MLNKDSVIVVSDNLTSADLGGEAVILDLDKGNYYGLNEVGARVLELIKQPTPVHSVLEVLRQEYEVNHDELEKDILSFLTNMGELNLIRITNDTAS
jgi:hypothetical protein